MGCPNQCVFCNQRSISGCQSFDRWTVKQQIDRALSTIEEESEVEIAFFGGSFTGIDRSLMIDLLETAEQYVKEGRVNAIRLSTRPDYIADEILSVLSRYSVKTIELGLQSMDDRVLNASGRGHSAKQAMEACERIVRAGFSLVGQMMIGLPQSTLQAELETAETICRLGASAARIYPTVVFYDTPLCEMVKNGTYLPLTVEDAVSRSAAVLKVFGKHNVPCIRIGLCAGEDFSDDAKVMAGPNHPALGEMVLGEIYYEKLIASFAKADLLGRKAVLVLPAREISKYVGQHRCNLKRLLRETDTRVKKVVGMNDLEHPMPVLWQRNTLQNEEEQPQCI